MAIIYSYPLNSNILPTDILLGVSTVVQNGRPKNQTKSFEVGDFVTYILSALPPPVIPTLQEVCDAGAIVLNAPILLEDLNSSVVLSVVSELDIAISGQSAEGWGIRGNTDVGRGVYGSAEEGYGVYGSAFDGIGIFGTCSNEGVAIFADGGGLGTGVTVLNGGVNILGVLNPVSGYQLKLSQNAAAKPSTNTWTITSDSRVKTNVNPYTKGLEAILSINPITYDYNGKAGFEQLTNNIGIIAQDVLDIMPECINTYKAKLNEDDEEYTELYNFDSHALTFALINAVKELSERIVILENK